MMMQHSHPFVSSRTRADDDTVDAHTIIETACVDECVICLDPMIDGSPTVSLGCTHKFHGQCLVTHMINDVRCPVCRYCPNDRDDNFDEDEEVVPSITLGAALKLAKKDKKNKATIKSLGTIAKWKKIGKAAKATIRCVAQKLTPHENEMYNKIQLHDKKLQADFNHRFAEDFQTRQNASKDLSKSWTQIISTQRRLACKYGWIRRNRIR